MMAMVRSISDLAPDQVRRATGRGAPGGAHTDFFKATRDAPDGPSAYLVHNGPLRPSSPHFHAVDQFQIVLEGDGTFGRIPVDAYTIHFARAFTPYGPLQSGKDAGWVFMTLRTHYDPGSQRMATESAKLRAMSNRDPWQVHEKLNPPAMGPGVQLVPAAKLSDERGLAAWSLAMAPGAVSRTPDPSAGNGQFVLITEGSLLYQDRERAALTVVFIRPREGSLELKAGAQGLRGIILNFPAPRPPAINAPAAAAH
jgi:hypothetical protein